MERNVALKERAAEPYAIEVSPDVALTLLDLPVDMEGFHHFIGIWLIQDRHLSKTLLVDVGPASASPLLLERLSDLGVRAVDFLLLTHVHIDHAGGVGHLAKAFPGLKVIAPEKGKRHLVDPSALWEGSLKTLGKVAEIYGKMIPLPGDRLIEGLDGVTSIDTPGHAPYHNSYVYAASGCKILFPGEAAGVFLPKGLAYPDGASAGFPYIRPATPPKFFFDVTLESLKKVEAVDAEWICYPHFGPSHEPENLLRLHEGQLFRFKDTTVRAVKEGAGEGEEAVDIILSRLLEEDPLLSEFARLPEDIRSRERFFLQNSIRGFLDYVQREGLKA